MSPEMIMGSCYRAFTWACGAVPSKHFFELPQAEADTWRKFMSVAPAVVDQADGKPFDMIAERLHKGVLGTNWDENTPRKTRLTWGALARHLADLVCGDEAPRLENLPAMEAKWKKWVEDRSIKLGT